MLVAVAVELPAGILDFNLPKIGIELVPRSQLNAHVSLASPEQAA